MSQTFLYYYCYYFISLTLEKRQCLKLEINARARGRYMNFSSQVTGNCPNGSEASVWTVQIGQLHKLLPTGDSLPASSP